MMIYEKSYLAYSDSHSMSSDAEAPPPAAAQPEQQQPALIPNPATGIDDRSAEPSCRIGVIADIQCAMNPPLAVLIVLLLALRLVLLWYYC